MDTIPVTLIVKAPNQQIEDQTIKCDVSWSINKLKQHLSEVYPSKPPKHEQKLIYSGQLLNDSVILKDVLRQFDGQDTHTVHLVCAPKHNQIRRPSPTTPASQQQPQNMAQNAANPTPNQTESRNLNGGAEDQRVPNMYPNASNMPWFRPENAEQLALHMQMMQQAYFQYMTQYMNMNANANLQFYSSLQRGPNGQQIPLPRENIQPQEAPQQPPPVPQPPRDQDIPNRDWLDVFYMLSRVMVFVSIVYFYSSPLRFIFVLLFGLGLYLYQVGFFRNVNINNNNIMQGEGGAEEQAPSRFMVVWTFFTSFFTSLIPEIPNVV